LGDGVAIPHARNAIDGVTDHAVVVFGRHDQGIAYGASDGRPSAVVLPADSANDCRASPNTRAA
jgi:mannitol/fructose-specific phosphotransferase system IIA component (Ntr-type)